MARGSLRWSPTLTTRLGRAVLYAPLGLLGGFLLLVTIALFSIPVVGILGGDVGTTLFGVVNLFVGGWASILYLWVVVRYGEDNAQWVEPYIPVDRLDGPWFGLASVVGAVVIVTAVLIEPWLIYGALAAIFVLTAFGWWLHKTYELDGEGGTLTVGVSHPLVERTTVPLESLTGVRWLPIRVRGFRMLVCRRVDGLPFVVPVPAGDATSIERALRGGVESDPADTPTPATTSRGMRIILYASSLMFVIPGVLVATLVVSGRGVSDGRLILVTGMLALYGALPLGYAVLESYRARGERKRADRRGGPDEHDGTRSNT